MTRSGIASQLLATLLAAVAIGACRGEPQKVGMARPEVRPDPGDYVVVEQTAAVFFEGRVLGAEGDRLRIQAADDKNSLTVAASDVYRLPEPKVKDRATKGRSLPQPGGFAICRSGPQRWQPCRIERLTGEGVAAVGASGEQLDVPSDGVIGPSPVTELNLRRHFERARGRLEFTDARARAGEPRAPADFRPTLRGRVLARTGSGWFTAYVREIDEEGVLVAWQSDRGTSKITMESIVPEPPYAAEVRRGDFVLVRPVAPALPWEAVLVRSVGNGELRIVDIEGRQRSISKREVVPLSQG